MTVDRDRRIDYYFFVAEKGGKLKKIISFGILIGNLRKM